MGFRNKLSWSYDHILRFSFSLVFAAIISSTPRVGWAGEQTVQDSTLIDKNIHPDDAEVIIMDRIMVLGDPDKIDEIPGSAHFIDRKRLRKQAYNDILRVLREVPGINIQEEDGYGLRPNIGMRGTGSNRSEKITLMEDGILIAPAPYAAPAAYYFPTTGRMQGIEIRKGSSQIKHGPYTTGGALNLISTKIPYRFGGSADLSVGSDAARTIHANMGDAYRNFGWLVEAHQTKADGYKQLDGGGNTGFDVKDYIAKVRVNTNPDARTYQELLFKVGQRDEVSNETYLGLTDQDFLKTPHRRYAGSQLDQINTDHEQYQVRYFLQPGDRLDFTAAVYRNNFRRNWYKLDRVGAAAEGSRFQIANVLQDPVTYADEMTILSGGTSPNDDVLEVKANNRSYWAQGIQMVFGFHSKPERTSHDLEVGLRIHRDQIDRFQWVDKYRMQDGRMLVTEVGGPGTESNRLETATAFATFAQYKLSVGKATLTPGLRYERIHLNRKDYGKSDPGRVGTSLDVRKNDVDVWIPGIGVDYRIRSSGNIFVGIHKGFAPPGSKAGTRPEKSINYEAGIRLSRKASGAQAIFYYNDYSNLLGSDLAATGGTGSGDLFNGGSARVVGLEFDLRLDPGTARGSALATPLRLAYTLTKTEFRSIFESAFGQWGSVQEGDELPYIAQHQLFLSAGLQATRWSVDVSAKYSSRMRTAASSGPILENLGTDAHFVVDTVGELALVPQARLFAGVRNLTNRNYIVARRPAGVRPGLPRTFVSGIRTDF